MNAPQAVLPAAIVDQEPDEEYPAQVRIDPLEAEFIAVFRDIDPNNQCPHCWDQARTMFMAGLACLNDAFVSVSDIRDEKARDAATDWVQKQVDEASDCVRLTRSLSKASKHFNVHTEPDGKH